MTVWRYDIESKWLDDGNEWESGYESKEYAEMAMDERITEIIDEIAAKHPELSDEEIESFIDGSVREE